MLHMGVESELRAKEKCAFNVISEYKVKNEKIFTKNMQAIKEREHFRYVVQF